MKKNNIKNIFYIFLLSQPFIDLITALMTRFLNTSFTVGTITRGLFLVLLVVYTLFFTKTKYKRKTIYYLIATFLFVILYFVTKSDIFSLEYLKTEVIYMFKYFYFPIVSICLINCYSSVNLDKEKINKIFAINAVVFGILLILPYITKTDFSSYDGGKGSVGWFYSANEVGSILTILFPYLFCLLNDKKYLKFILYVIIVNFAMMIIGTKTAFLGMIFTEIVFLLYYIFTKERSKRLLLSAFILIMSLFLIPNLPAITNLSSSIDKNNKVEIDKDEKEIIEDKTIDKKTNTYKVLNVVFSGRQNFLYNTLNIYKKRPAIDKVFGVGFVNRDSVNNTKITKLIEIDFLDIFFHYGIIGFLVYFTPLIYFLIKSLFYLIKTKYNITFNKILYLYSTILLIGVSCIAGHVLSAPAVSIYLAVTLVLFNNEINLVTKNKLKDDEITILALHLNYGGVEKYISSLCKMLDSDYKINLIVTYKISKEPAFYFSDRVKITYLINNGPNKQEFKNAIQNKDIKNIIKEGFRSIKILYLKKNKNIEAIKEINSKYIITTREFHNKLVGAYANREIIKIATEHNYHNNDKKYISKLIRSIKKFDYLVVVSNNLKDFYQDKVKKAKVIYIPNVIDNMPDKRSELKNNNLVTVGRLEKEKGQEDLIEIVKKVKKKIKDVKLYLIGDGSLKKELIDKVKENNLEDTIIFTGFLSKDDMEKYLIKSKLFVMTSFTESFGLVLIEAMSYGLPCIAFDSADGAKNLLKDDIGFLIKDRDKDKMALQIIELLNKNISENSNKAYEFSKKFLCDNIKQAWLKLLDGSVNYGEKREKK